MTSVSRDRSQNNLHQQFEGVDIDWTVIEKQLLMWGDLFRNKGKKLRLDICINYLADGSEPTTSRPGDKRGTTSVTKTMLSKRDAQIDAEHSSGQPSPWRNVYKTMHCPGPPCQNKDGYCWQDPVRKKHYYLKTHHLKCLVELVKKKKLNLGLRIISLMRSEHSSMQKISSGLRGKERLPNARRLSQDAHQ